MLFQVAGGCGLGALKAADEANKWGIGVDVDQYNAGQARPHERVKRVDNGVYQAIQQVKAGKFAGGSDLVFNLKNGGIGVGKMNPAVTAADKAAMNQLQGADHQRQAQAAVRRSRRRGASRSPRGGPQARPSSFVAFRIAPQ